MSRQTGAMADAVAIVGMACRFPGAPHLDAYWRLLHDGRDALTRFSELELLAAGVEQRLLDDPAYVRAGMVLDDIDRFDAGFFHVAALEAEMMDPQQRLLLETAWHALEDAGRPPADDGQRVAVYVGGRASDYLLYHQPPPDIFGHFEPSPPTGLQRLVLNDKDYLATRLAYLMDLRGPAITLQTACSTSLVAAHMACQALLDGECDMALAGGASLRVPQRVGYLYSEGMIFPPDGCTRPFDANASGPLVGSGVGIVVLRRLADAIADGDAIYAVIRGSAVNNDGARGKSAFTAPSLAGQVRVLAEALAVSQVDPGTVSYIEAHGTSTRVGDPVEIAALAEAFGTGLPPRTCAIGSVKSNVGHLFHAAGVAGLIKTALMLHHRTLVPIVGFDRLNPLIDFEGSPFFINTERRVWHHEGGVLRAGVSAFGFGGTNAHVILEEAPAHAPVPRRPEPSDPVLLPVSARSGAALRELTRAYAESIELHPEWDPVDLCHTAQQGRQHFSHRTAVVATSCAVLREHLIAGPAGSDERDTAPAPQPQLAFLFAGQGTQYAGMGRQLYRRYPVFRRCLDDCGRLLEAELGCGLVDLMFGPQADAALTRTEYAQPALLAFEAALTTLWRAWGVEPDVVLGHSLGELTAAWASGVFSLEDALHFAVARGRLMQRANPGAMAAVFAAHEPVTAILEEVCRGVSVAAINGLEQTVISGDRPCVERALAACEVRGVAGKLMPGQTAFHSPLMDDILADLEASAARLTPHAPTRSFVSSLTGALLQPDVRWPDHLRRQAREPVQFTAALTAAIAAGANTFMEIGPDALLTGLGAAAAGSAGALWLPSLRTGGREDAQVLTALGRLYERGIEVNWSQVEPAPARRLRLPLYPFQRRSFWIARAATPHRPAPMPVVHPLVGRRVASPLEDIQFQNELTADCEPFARDHWVYGARPLVMVGLLEMVRAAAVEGLASSLARGGDVVVEDVVVEQPLLLTSEPRRVQTILSPSGDATGDVRVFSAAGPDTAWDRHVTARVQVTASSSESARVDLAEIRARCPVAVSGGEIVAEKRARGADLGPAFDIVSCAWRGKGEVLVEAAIQDDDRARASLYGAHPGVFDACAQCAWLTQTADDKASSNQLFLPMLVNRVVFHDRLGDRICLHLRRRTDAGGAEVYGIDATLTDGSGRVLVDVEGLFFKRATPESLRQASAAVESSSYEVEWVPLSEVTSAASTSSAGTWLILADDGGLGASLATRLEQHGGSCVVQLEELAPAELAARLGHLVRTGCRGIVDLRSLERVEPLDDPMAGLRRTCGPALTLVQALLAEEAALPLWLITRGAQATGRETARLAPAQAVIWGFGRVVQREQASMVCRLVDLDPAGPPDVEALAAVIARGGSETEIAVRASTTYVSRLRRHSPASQGGPDTYAVRPGPERTLNGLSIVPAARKAPSAGEIEIAVQTTGLNFRDVLNATGRIDGPLGYECSGIVTRCGASVEGMRPGTAVMALAPGAFASHVTIDARFAVVKPPHVSHAAASGMVVAYLTAYHGLVERAGLACGQRVLIHTAAGGVGLAAIQIARSLGAEVFATASRAKWDYVRSLGVAAVFDSRTPGFAGALRAATGDCGIDVALNTLGPSFTEDTLAAMRRGGRLVELGHPAVHDLARTARLAEARGIEFINFHIAQDVAAPDPAHVQRVLTTLMGWLEAGRISPLPVRVFPWTQLRDAFETMLRGAHVAKLVVAHPAADHVPPAVFAADGTYLITGGFGALGWRIVEWLISRGARHLAIVSRRPPSAERARAMNTHADAGVAINWLRADVADASAMRGVLAQIDRDGPPLRGVVHAAGITDDGVIPAQDWPRFESVLSAKAVGAWNLHQLTAAKPLDLFVLISSAAGLLGNSGQANYAAANVFLDQLAYYRRQFGFPALAMDYGLWSGSGLGAALSDAARGRRLASGMRELDPETAIRALERAVVADRTQVAVLAADWAVYAHALAGTVPPMLSELVVARPATRARRLEPPAGSEVTPQSVEDVIERIRPHVAALGHMSRSFDAEKSLPDLGLDSLAVLLLRGRLIAEFGTTGSLPVVSYLERRAVSHLAAMIWERTKPAATAVANGLRSLIPLRPEGDKIPIFLVPPAGRTITVLSPLASAFELGHPVYGLNPVGMMGEAEPHRSIEAMAAHYVAEIRSIFPSGPCVVGGMCFGAIVAWEMAIQLRAAGRNVGLFVDIDGAAPRPLGGVLRRAATNAGDVWRFWSVRFQQHLRGGSLHFAAARELARLAHGALPAERFWNLGVPDVEPIARPLWAAQGLAAFRYRARPLTWRKLIIVSEELRSAVTDWKLLGSGQFDTLLLTSASHPDVVNPEFARTIADAVSVQLRLLS